MKLSGYRMGIKLDKDPLVVQQNNSTTKTVKAYIFYDSRTPTNNFKFKNSLFGATSAVKNSDKGKYVLYSGYGITFDSAGSWIFNNDTAENVINANNHKNNFLVLGQGLTFAINGSLFTKQNS